MTENYFWLMQLEKWECILFVMVVAVVEKYSFIDTEKIVDIKKFVFW